MRFGLNFFPAFRSSDLSAADYFAQTLRICERGDELGFDSVKTVEHYFHEYGGYSTNPSILLSAIAARTKRMRPITGAVIPAFNNPLKLAGELPMLDASTNCATCIPCPVPISSHIRRSGSRPSPQKNRSPGLLARATT